MKILLRKATTDNEYLGTAGTNVVGKERARKFKTLSDARKVEKENWEKLRRIYIPEVDEK